ncbi:MAG TPA: flagellar export chaperone FliS [Allosphingosinicella sp.]|jgi:flagellar protein FliS|nr:flagellar export chaperone FliS [Allosphingosinicella sp.]
MYVAKGQFGAARARYQQVDVVSRVEGADPHALVTILYEELLKALDAMAVAAARKDFTQRGDKQARALRLLTGLETSLDFEQGGELAVGLARVYREARRLVIGAGRENDVRKIAEAREMLAGVAEAWSQIRAAA